ncbi:hypothetical protein KCU90_g155, partial [Aureobasidium melanogenum]
LDKGRSSGNSASANVAIISITSVGTERSGDGLSFDGTDAFDARKDFSALQPLINQPQSNNKLVPVKPSAFLVVDQIPDQLQLMRG